MLTRFPLPGLLVAAALPFLFTAASAEASGWTIPNGAKPNFTDVYNNGNSITWSWGALNQSLSDLWLTKYDTTSSYAVRIAANINIADPGTLPWTITVNTTEIDIDDRFRLRFTLTGTAILPLDDDQLASPAFIILQRGEAIPESGAAVTTTESAYSIETTGTALPATETLASSTVPATLVDSSAFTTSFQPQAAASTALPAPAASSSAPANSDSSGLSAGIKAGIAIAVTAVVIVIIALSLWVIRLHRRIRAAANHHSWGIIPDPAAMPATGPETSAVKHISGLHEVLGDRRQPTEMSSKEDMWAVHEMPG